MTGDEMLKMIQKRDEERGVFVEHKLPEVAPNLDPAPATLKPKSKP